MTDFKNEINNILSDFKDETNIEVKNKLNDNYLKVISLLSAYETIFDNKLTILEENIDKKIEDIEAEKIVVYDPTRGETLPVKETISNVYNALRYEALEAQEYDALELTAENYDNHKVGDAIGLTAIQYDVSGKSILKYNELSEYNIVDKLSESLTSAESNIESLQTSVTQNTADIETLKTTGGGGGVSQSDFNALQLSVTQNTTDIATNKANIESNDTNISNLDTRITSLESAGSSTGGITIINKGTSTINYKDGAQTIVAFAPSQQYYIPNKFSGFISCILSLSGGSSGSKTFKLNITATLGFSAVDYTSNFNLCNQDLAFTVAATTNLSIPIFIPFYYNSSDSILLNQGRIVITPNNTDTKTYSSISNFYYELKKEE